ncbi:hypothetical protein Hanom_Chr07g00642141 [Helianthus anomalus]
MISPHSLEKERARGRSQPDPKTMSTCRTDYKRKKTTDNIDDAFQVEHHFHDVIIEVGSRILISTMFSSACNL